MLFLEGWALGSLSKWAIGIIVGIVLGWIIKQIPFNKFAVWAEKIGKVQGVAITKFFNSKLPKFWNSVIEPVFIDTINSVCIAWIRGLMIGLKSDNK